MIARGVPHSSVFITGFQTMTERAATILQQFLKLRDAERAEIAEAILAWHQSPDRRKLEPTLRALCGLPRDQDDEVTPGSSDPQPQVV